MNALLTIAAVAVTIAVPALLIRLTGGPGVLYTARTLTRPRSTTPHAPRRADG